MEMKNVYHGHLIVSRIDEDGWTHELFPVEKPRRDGAGWVWDSIGASCGRFPDLSKAIAEAKRLCPPEPVPQIENVTFIDETEK